MTLMFQLLVLRRGAFHVRHVEWPTAARPSDMVWPAICSSTNTRARGEHGRVFDLGDVLVRLYLSEGGLVEASLASVDTRHLAAAERALLQLLRARPRRLLSRASSPSPSGATGVRSSTRRRLPTPTWHEIQRNYAPATRSLLQPLFEHPECRDAGQLLLWHGEPGTGKTHAIRALAQAWRSWCDVHYVMDPEMFFGSTSSYMRDVLLNTDGYYEPSGEEPEPEEPEQDERWRLLVLEDTGELLGIEAKADTGQALSRLLNLVDGLLGQDLKLLVLITTNEPLAKLHPAVVRPGRCASIITFEPLSAQDTNAWLEAHGSSSRVTSATPLGDLYGLLAGRRPAVATRKVGFV